MIPRKNVRKVARAEAKKIVEALLNPVVKIVAKSEMPVCASSGSAGFDIHADLWEIKEDFLVNAEVVRNEDNTIEGILLHPQGQCLVPTGIHTSFSSNYVVSIVPRSGLALKKRITITNSPGTIDSDYKDEWGIILANEGSEDLLIHQGDRVAQFILSLVCHPRFEVVETVEQLSGPDRGGGYGHSKV